MQKSKSRLSILSLLIMTASLPLFAATNPVSLNFPANGQFKLDISNDNPNLIVVPGDRIIALNTGNGMLSDKKNTKEGAVIIATTAEKPFTLFIETEKGQAFSVHAIPKAGPGKSYRLQAQLPVNRKQAESWEQSQPYESMLVSIGRSFIQGILPTGYTEIPVLNDSIKIPAGTSATALKSWAGGRLKVTKFQLVNNRSVYLPLNEKDFWQTGVRAVMFEYRADNLAANGAINIFVIRNIEGDK